MLAPLTLAPGLPRTAADVAALYAADELLSEYLPVARATDGCDWYAACLTCPLPRCRYDHDDDDGAAATALTALQAGQPRTPQPQTRAGRSERNAAMVADRLNEGMSAQALAAKYGMTQRSVDKILRQAREEARPVGAHSGDEGTR